MALEFDCPYCQAIIRVPDNAGGKKGRCPQCTRRLTVPKKGRLRTPEEPAIFPGLPEPPPVPIGPPPPAEEEVVFQEFNPQQADEPIPIDDDVLPGGIVLPDLVAAQPRSLPLPPQAVPDVSVIRKRRKQRVNIPGLLFAVALLAVATGTIGYLVYTQTTKLEGKLAASLVQDSRLAPVTVPRSLLELGEDDLEKILADLERNPRPLVSSLGLSEVVIAANPSGLRISVAPGSATSLYRVDITSDAKLAAYRRQHEPELDRLRVENLAIAANQYCRAMLDASSKKITRSDVTDYRDSVCYAACVRGFGSTIQAVHKRQTYLCVYEDKEAVYFLLPAGVKQFEILGRPRAAGEPFFEGRYYVTVTGTTQLPDAGPEEPPAEKPKPAEEKMEAAEEMEAEQ